VPKRLNAILFACLLLASASLGAQDRSVPLAGFWHDYEGTLGQRKMFLTFFPSETGELVGNYFFVEDESNIKIPLAGRLDGHSIELSETGPGDTSGRFRGTLYSEKKGDDKGYDRVEGRYERDVGSEPLTFALRMTGSGWGTAAKRYMDLHGTDEEVEQYARRAKAAILARDREWVADQLFYPLKAHVRGKEVLVPTRDDFVTRYFDVIFHADFRRKVKGMQTVDLHQSNGGLMLGGGSIWIFSTQSFPDKLDGQPRYFLDWFST
jgi:hypothetical protein